MPKFHHFNLLIALSMCGGIATAQPKPPQLDAGARADSASLQMRDGGDAESKSVILESKHGSGRPRLLATLDGRAVVAAQAAIRDLRERFVKQDKRNAGSCEASPRAMDVLISEAKDMYIMRINRRLDRCGWADPSFNSAFDPEFYAVSPGGKFLVRNPYNHAAPVVHKPLIVDGIRWPEESRLLASLDARAVVASYVAMEGFRTRFVKDKGSRGDCGASPKNVNVLVFEMGETYAVRISPRAGTCGWIDPNLNVGLEPEVFVVSPEGKLLGRYPYSLFQLVQTVLSIADDGASTRQPALPNPPKTDAEISAAQPGTGAGVRWPRDMLPLAILDAPAIAAASAALQHLQARLSQKHGAACAAPADAMQILIGRDKGLYYVSIEHPGGRCGAADAGSSTGADEIVLYAVSPEGRVQMLSPEEQ
jgi:hypothetical protein